MRTQFRHGYEVDNRYKGLKRGVDASAAQKFLKGYIGRLREKGFPRPKVN